MASWVSPGETAKYRRSPVGGPGGWFAKGLRWPDYLERWKPEARRYLEALRDEALSRGIRGTGAWHADELERGVPLFNDGTFASFSQRGWADLMAAIWSGTDGRDYGYADFYA